jgi:hypothetical protein
MDQIRSLDSLYNRRDRDNRTQVTIAMLFNRSAVRLQIVPAALAGAITIPLLGWYLYLSWESGRWLGGGSLPGLVLGTAAAGIIAWEMMLWPRKLLRRMRLLPAKYWLACHIWFGLACLPLAIFHAGFHLGGWFATLVLGLLVATVISGLYGVVVQNILPRWMLRNLPAETITSQIDHVAMLAVSDADNLLRAACGPRETVMTMQLGDMEVDRFKELFGDDTAIGMTRAIVIGAPRQAGRMRGRVLDTQTVTRQKEDARSLWSGYDEIRPYLRDGQTGSNIFGDPARSTGWFRLLRHACSAEAERVIGPLERLVEQRRQFEIQRRIHGWLQAWLPVHIGLSVGLCLLLVVHIVVALRYW